jgi:hypothetical protein
MAALARCEVAGKRVVVEALFDTHSPLQAMVVV